MKGILKHGVSISATEQLITGSEVDIITGYCTCNGHEYQCVLADGRQVPINSEAIHITDYRPYVDWEKRRYEIAKDVLAAFMANNEPDVHGGSPRTQAIAAVEYADALIEELRKEVKE